MAAEPKGGVENCFFFWKSTVPTVTQVDEDISRSFVAHCLVDGLQSFRSCKHQRRVNPGLAGRKSLTAFLGQLTEDDTSEVLQALTTGRDRGCRFAIQVDGWKRRPGAHTTMVLCW